MLLRRRKKSRPSASLACRWPVSIGELRVILKIGDAKMKKSGSGHRNSMGRTRTIACAGLALAFLPSNAWSQTPYSERQQQSIVSTTRSNTKDRVAAPLQSSVPPVRTPSAPASADFTVTGTYSDGTTRFFKVKSRVDSIVDGHLDAGLLRVACANGEVASTYYKVQDAGSGMATGKRQHRPSLIIKEMKRDGTAIGARLSWALVQAKGIQENGLRKGINQAGVRRTVGQGHLEALDDWSEVRLTSGAVGLCR